MNKYGQVEEHYIVWVGGSEIGRYDCEYDAGVIADEWIEEGYQDVQIEEIDVDSETPEETNEWLRSGGY